MFLGGAMPCCAAAPTAIATTIAHDKLKIRLIFGSPWEADIVMQFLRSLN
jgi:hypothetical protein